MNYKKVVLDFLMTEYGTTTNPKSDSRVEIPQSFVRTMGWKKYKKLYASYDNGGEIYISTDAIFHKDDAICIEIVVHKGRVRLPAKFLKEVEMADAPLVLIEADNLAVVRLENSHNETEIKNLLNECLLEDDIKRLANLIMGKDEANDEMVLIPHTQFHAKAAEIPSGEIARVPAKNTVPSLILLDPDGSTVFRPTGSPYKFAAYWKDKELILCNDMDKLKPSKLYLIPGIQRVSRDEGSFIFGFLLLDEIMFGKVCYRIVQIADKTPIGTELIFIHNCNTFGMFKIYENPDETLQAGVMLKAKQMCSSPEQFLKQTFTIIDSRFNASIAPLSINSKTVENKRRGVFA